jgi:hypothetical protein
MTDRHTVDSITSDELDQLYDRVEFYEAAIARIRAIHYQDGDYCTVCTTDFGRLNATWPCDTIRALGEPTPGPAATQATAPCPACRRADQAGLAPTEQHPTCAKEQP